MTFRFVYSFTYPPRLENTSSFKPTLTSRRFVQHASETENQSKGTAEPKGNPLSVSRTAPTVGPDPMKFIIANLHVEILAKVQPQHFL